MVNAVGAGIGLFPIGIVYREFLFRMVDLELLSAHALGDANRLLGRFAALLVTVSISLVHALEMAGIIATTMLAVGLFAFSFLVRLFHSLQHAGLSRRTL
jgi:hypothetical protein